MKKIYTILSFCAVAALFASCQKDNLTGSTFTATIEQCNDSKTKTALSGSILNWVAGDQVIIMNELTYFGVYTAREGGSTTTTFIFQPNASGTGMDIDVGDPEASCYNESYPQPYQYMAIYPADIVDLAAGGIRLPATQVTTDGTLRGFPMYAESQTRNLRFKNAFGLLKLHLEKPETSITSISITADRVINGFFVIDYNVDYSSVGVPTLVYAEDGSGTNTVTLQCGEGNGISIDNGADFYIYLPPATDYHNLTINMTNSEGGFCSLTSPASVNIPIIRSQYTTIELGDNDLDFIEIEGLFSVAPGQYVQFSPGNLQYSTSNNTWRFAPSQIDMIGELNYNYFTGTTPTTDWIDLFSWGETQVASMTPSTTGYSSFYEWGNNVTGGWRTLTNDQWKYLMFQRPDAAYKVGGATVAGVKGLILLPDSWSLPAGCSFTPGFSYSNFYSTNIYSATEAAAMQSAGAVFLPAAGVVVHGTETHNGQVVPVWYYSHTILDLEENWFESTAFLAGLGHMIYVIIRDANLYWSSTPYQGQDGLVDDANVYQAYGMAFTNLSGVTEDVEHGGGDIFSFPNNIWVINEETNRRVDFNDIFNNPTFIYTPGQYIFDLPIPSGLAKGAVRLVRDVTPSSSK